MDARLQRDDVHGRRPWDSATVVVSASTPVSGRSAARYTSVAIALHWIMAILIIANIALAEFTSGLSREVRAPYMDLHKIIGISVLVLTLFRLGWRLGHPPPPLPDALPTWQRHVAHASHLLFYVLLLALPLSGWLWMSSIPAPMAFPGAGSVPLLPVAGQEALGTVMRRSHQLLGNAMIG